MNHHPKEKTTYCHRCQKPFHYLGIAQHRRAHIRRGEMVLIEYTDGGFILHRPKANSEKTRDEVLTLNEKIPRR